MIFESHAHYDDEAFDCDREELLHSFKDKGVSYVINVGASMESIDDTIALAQNYPFMYGALGIHPTEAGDLTEKNILYIKEECIKGHIIKKGGKIVAVGEIGLDYHWPEPEHDIQKKWFRRQLELAIEVELPVILHSREAAQDTLLIIKEYEGRGLRGVMHCYSYSTEIASQYLDMGYYFGIGGVVTFQNAKKLKEVVEFLPMDKILLETDSPYLAPVPNRGKRNSSLNLPDVAREIAAIKKISYEEVVRQTCDNAKKLFGVY